MICFGSSLKTKTNVSIVFCNALRVRRREKREDSVLALQLSFSPTKKPGKMESTHVPEASSSLILTSGATSRVNALISLKALKSLAMLLSGLFMLLLIPFQRKQNRCIEKPREDGKQDVVLHRKQQPILRVAAPLPSLISRRSNNQVSGDQDSLERRSIAMRSVVQRDGDSIREFSLFVNSRGETLFTQSWTPVSVKIKGLVVLLHGLNEHSGRYNQFAKQLNTNGYKVYAIDWIGHGGSDGLHGYVHSLDYAVSDTKAYLEKVLVENPGFPCFFFGHSTGGSIVLKTVLDPKIEGLVEGIVLTSPAIRVQPSHPIFGVLAPIFSFLLPKYQFGAANKKGLPVSRDPEALVAKYSDPLVYTGSIRVRTGSEILRISTYLQQNLKNIRIPFLVLHGTYDTVTDPDASQQLYDEASSTDKSIKLYEGLLHDLLFEPEREAITKDIIDWLDSKLKV